MKRVMPVLIFLVLSALGIAAWAGPAEDVAQMSAPRLQAFLDGNVDGYVAAYADNAVFHSSFTPLRIEGKEAIRAFFTGLFRMYPKRHVFIRHPVMRAYNDDLVVQGAVRVLEVSDASLSKGDSAFHYGSRTANIPRLDGCFIPQSKSKSCANGRTICRGLFVAR